MSADASAKKAGRLPALRRGRTWAAGQEEVPERIKRVPLPKRLPLADVGPLADAAAPGCCCRLPLADVGPPVRRTARGADVDGLDCRALEEEQRGLSTDWVRVRLAAGRICDPDYSLADFHADLAAFPELHLYLLEGESTTSGRTVGDEYQRTVGAFFAIYWLMRLRGDGKEGFVFGVDELWRTFLPPARGGGGADAEESEDRRTDRLKRLCFYRESHWRAFEQLLLDAGLLVEEAGELRPEPARVATLLCLTAVHDIMKVETLLPRVHPKHAPYHGYGADVVIMDHDQALSYVMDHYPHLLPSFDGLPAGEQRTILFTQSELAFNNGWLVQAEAPPGATFTKFRECLRSQIEPRDVALYFVHWLTDLGGAEPTPLGGCEKFVVKFPLVVLNSFLRSFEVVQKIAHMTETDVMEEYLRARWTEHEPPLGSLPTGSEAIAKMRIVCMAQANAVRCLRAFQELGDDDRAVLSAEMSRTGCSGQSFVEGPGASLPSEGPALLVYYGPAYLQGLGTDRAAGRLCVLAEVYRRARALWPPRPDEASHSVIVRIDNIKALSLRDLRDAAAVSGDVWVLVRHNDQEAAVERSTRERLGALETGDERYRILDLAAIAEAWLDAND